MSWIMRRDSSLEEYGDWMKLNRHWLIGHQPHEPISLESALTMLRSRMNIGTNEEPSSGLSSDSDEEMKEAKGTDAVAPAIFASIPTPTIPSNPSLSPPLALAPAPPCAKLQRQQNKLRRQGSALPKRYLRANFGYEITAILKGWMYANLEEPKPNDCELTELMEMTNLTRKQIENWFSNSRSRIWKPRIEALIEKADFEGDGLKSRHYRNLLYTYESQKHNPYRNKNKRLELAAELQL